MLAKLALQLANLAHESPAVTAEKRRIQQVIRQARTRDYQKMMEQAGKLKTQQDKFLGKRAELRDDLAEPAPKTGKAPQLSREEALAGVSIKEDKDGFYATTHRARSKSYPSVDKIPTSKLRFIESTG